MNEQWFEKMDRYLQGGMSQEERLLFESELAADKTLASVFNVFRIVDEEMRNEVKNSAVKSALKRSVADRFEEFLPGEVRQIPVIKSFSHKRLYITIASVAASVIIIFLVTFLFFFRQTTDMQQLAGQYINENLTVLPYSMGIARNTIEQGKAAFNQEDYGKALQLFEAAYKTDSSNADAKKYIGVVCLVTKDYDKAIRQFDELAGVTSLKYNWGQFYKAVTLLCRNRAGDKEKARQALKKVLAEDNARGDEEAERWLKELE